MTAPTAEQLADYQILTTGAGLVSLPRTQLALSGEDRATFLQAFCTGDIKKLQTGMGCEAFITNHQGKVAGHVLVFCDADRLLLDGAPGQAEKLIVHLDRFVISERVEFRDLSTDHAEFLLAGPTSAAVLQKLNIAPAAERLSHAKVSIGGEEVSLRTVDLLRVPNFLFSVPATAREVVQRAIVAAGAKVCSEAAFELARLEAGYPIFGTDISEENLPQEVQRNTQAISFTKGCYLGQETIARLDALGHVNRVLTGLKLPANHGLAAGATILQGEKKLAQITSIGYSPNLGADLALAYVRTIHASPGKKLTLASGEAEVIALPLQN
ncbi:Aminomethyltransferase [Anatilimnocola aggregata]|uniref:Aminomethyltransferase n=1 Tax=Anatilimnocola aggregata TaxID=2528021 RepID=A0A517YDS9_9BACT|nr:glycine cleavage T C-terminal barrel domain-containing protein [Anatilimnocola aggregata]QDU28385.1 Aminomethyltransferase [Anatilimnocola aggregata]